MKPECLSAKAQEWIRRNFSADAAAVTPVAPPAPNKRDLRAEKALQNEFEQWLRLNGYMYRREPTHKATTAPVGCTDFLIVLPGARVCWIEYKTETGRLRPEQEAYHEQLRALGHNVYVCRSLPEAIQCLRDAKSSRKRS